MLLTSVEVNLYLLRHYEIEAWFVCYHNLIQILTMLRGTDIITWNIPHVSDQMLEYFA